MFTARCVATFATILLLRSLPATASAQDFYCTAENEAQDLFLRGTVLTGKGAADTASVRSDSEVLFGQFRVTDGWNTYNATDFIVPAQALVWQGHGLELVQGTLASGEHTFPQRTVSISLLMNFQEDDSPTAASKLIVNDLKFLLKCYAKTWSQVPNSTRCLGSLGHGRMCPYPR